MIRGNWWKLARLELTLAIRDRESLIWSLIAPIAMAGLMGSLFNDAPPGPTWIRVEGAQNPAYVTNMFTGLLKQRGLSISTRETAPAVVLPDSLIERLTGGKAAEAVVLKRGLSDLRAQEVAVKVREVMYTLTFAARPSWTTNPPDSGAVAALVSREGQLQLRATTLGKTPRLVSGHVHQLPAMLVMFLMFQLMTFFMVLWVEDLKSGKTKRIVMSPTPMRDLLAGQVMSRMVWGILQAVIILGVGSLILGVNLDVPMLPFVVILFAYMMSAISLGLLLGTFFRNVEKANAVGVMAGLFMAAIGGCWWPLEIVSEPMRQIAMFLPTGVTMDAIGEFIAFGADAPFPTLNFTILATMTAIFMPLAIRRMRRQIITPESS